MKKLVQKYEEISARATMTVAGDTRTRPGREMMRNQARAELPAIEKELMVAFRKAGFPVFVTGPGTAEFVNAARELAEVAFVDLSAATGEIHNAVISTIGHHRDFSPAVFAVMIREVKAIASLVGLTSIPDIKYDGPQFLPDSASCIALVNKYLVTYLGPEFLAGVVELAALKQVKDMECEAPVIPVLVTGLTQEVQDQIAPKLFQGKFVAATADATADEKTVTDVFKQVRKMMKQP
jgi:hypothetical protein